LRETEREVERARDRERLRERDLCQNKFFDQEAWVAFKDNQHSGSVDKKEIGSQEEGMAMVTLSDIEEKDYDSKHCIERKEKRDATHLIRGRFIAVAKLYGHTNSPRRESKESDTATNRQDTAKPCEDDCMMQWCEGEDEEAKRITQIKDKGENLGLLKRVGLEKNEKKGTKEQDFLRRGRAEVESCRERKRDRDGERQRQRDIERRGEREKDAERNILGESFWTRLVVYRISAGKVIEQSNNFCGIWK
jgi:hypothetical protein